jgi:hypothetical protein
LNYKLNPIEKYQEKIPIFLGKIPMESIVFSEISCERENPYSSWGK